MTDPIRDLLTAILEALDIPHPATVGDVPRHGEVLADRVMHTVIALHRVLADDPYLVVERTAEYLRKRLAQTPATGYNPWRSGR